FVCLVCSFFFQEEDGIRDDLVTGVQTCALPISEGGGGFLQAAPRMQRAKPFGIRGAAWRNPPPPSDTPQMVGDGMAGRPNTVIREIGLGTTEFMPLGGRRTAQDEVRAPIVAKKRVMIVERRVCRKTEGSWTERQT